jgi:hypothetical protein
LTEAGRWEKCIDFRVAQQDHQILAAERARQPASLRLSFTWSRRQRSDSPQELLHDRSV